MTTTRTTTRTSRAWSEAGGEHQLPFMKAAGRCLAGDREVRCPRCDGAALRSYFHVMNPAKATGTLWVWCPACRTRTHLPRVSPGHDRWRDPFAGLGLEAFAALETAGHTGGEPWMDRLDRLWSDGKLGE